MDTDQNSLSVVWKASEPVLRGVVSSSEVWDMMKDALIELIDRLEARVAQVAEESLIKTVETLEDEHNMSSV